MSTVLWWAVERAGMRRSGDGGDDGVAVSVGQRGNVGEELWLLSLPVVLWMTVGVLRVVRHHLSYPDRPQQAPGILGKYY